MDTCAMDTVDVMFQIKIDERPRCVSILKSGKNAGLQCKNAAKPGCTKCGVHMPKQKRNQIIPTCMIEMDAKKTKSKWFSCFSPWREYTMKKKSGNSFSFFTFLYLAYEYVSWFKTLYIALPMIATLLAIIYVWNAMIFLSRFVLSSLSRCVAPYIIPFIESDTIGKVNIIWVSIWLILCTYFLSAFTFFSCRQHLYYVKTSSIYNHKWTRHPS